MIERGTPPTRRTEAGLSLLEVLVALAVMAVSLGVPRPRRPGRRSRWCGASRRIEGGMPRERTAARSRGAGSPSEFPRPALRGALRTMSETEITFPSRLRVTNALSALGIAAGVVEFGESTRTSGEAAAAIGCEVAQIAKSIVFRGKYSDACVLVIASGADRIHEKKLCAALGEPVAKADAAFVRARTGFAIGGVAPVGHVGPVMVLVDRALWQLDPIWAAAGSHNAVFRLTADDLHRIPGIRVVDVRQSA